MTPRYLLDKFIKETKKRKDKYILLYVDTFRNDYFYVSYPNKKELVENYPLENLKNGIRFEGMIRINEDGTIDENLTAKNL